MALIKCTECGGMMSDKALRCPHCGAVNTSAASHQTDNGNVSEPDAEHKKKIWIWGVVALVVIAAASVAWWAARETSYTADETIVELTPEFIDAVHQYDELYPFSEGLAAVKKDGKYGYINTQGELVIPVQFYGAGGFSEGFACVYDENYKVSFIDTKGEVAIKTPYQLQYNNYLQGGVNPDGSRNIYLDDVEKISFENGICRIPVETGGEGAWDYKWIDMKGHEVAEPQVKKEEDTSEYVIFEKTSEDGETLYGIKDKAGTEVVAPAFSYISPISNGVASVRLTAYVFFPEYYLMREAQSRGEQTRLTMYGYVDLTGNTTFTDEDYEEFETFKRVQDKNEYYYNYNEQKRKEEEEEAERLRKMAQDREWIYGTWTAHVVINDPYLGRLESNDKLIISQSNIQVYRNGNLEYSGAYDIENGAIRYDRRNGSALVIPIDAANKRLEFGDGNYYSKSGATSSSQSSTNQNSSSRPFRTQADVMSYLSSHTFAKDGNVLKFKQDGIYLNGRAVTLAPTVNSFSENTAIVIGKNGAETYIFSIDVKNGKVYNGGNTYKIQ